MSYTAGGSNRKILGETYSQKNKHRKEINFNT